MSCWEGLSGSPFRSVYPGVSCVPAHVGKFPKLLIGAFIPAFLVLCEQMKNPESSPWLGHPLIKLRLQTGLTAEGISVIQRHTHRYGWYLSGTYWILWDTMGPAKPPPPSPEFSGTLAMVHASISCSGRLHVQ